MYTTSLSFASLAILVSNLVLSSASTTNNGWTYKSCQAASDFQDSSLGFVSVTNSTFMSAGLCTTKCADGYAFAALWNTECFCGQKFTAFAPSSQDTECNKPCPGYPADTCGGGQDASKWYSLYASGSPSSSNSTTTATTTSIPTTSSTSIVQSNSSAGVTSSTSPTSTPSTVSVSGAIAAVRVQGLGIFVSMIGMLGLVTL